MIDGALQLLKQILSMPAKHKARRTLSRIRIMLRRAAKRGYSRGFDAGKYVIEDARGTTKVLGTDTELYGPDKFAVAPELRNRMMTAAKAAADARVISFPTNAQWK